MSAVTYVISRKLPKTQEEGKIISIIKSGGKRAQKKQSFPKFPGHTKPESELEPKIFVNKYDIFTIYHKYLLGTHPTF